MADEIEPRIGFREYSDIELPEVIRAQVLSFLRIVWREGFTGPNRFRDWTSHPDQDAYHLLYTADDLLVSHLEIITTTVSVAEQSFSVQSPTAVLTYPTFRGEGWAGRLVAEATSRIDSVDADVGVLMCCPGLAGFYERTGWELVPGARIVAGQDGGTWTSDDVLLVRPTGTRSAEFRAAVEKHPMRVAAEW